MPTMTKQSKMKFSMLLHANSLLSLLSLFTISYTASAANCTSTPVSDQYYNIINYGTGKALDISGGETGNGGNAIQWTANGSRNQQFYLTDLGNGYWSMAASHSGRVVDVSGWSTADGANIHQWDYHGGSNQQWQLKHSSTGAFNIVSRHSGKSLTVANATNGGNVYQQSDSASPNQRWYFNPVDTSCGGADNSGTDDNGMTTSVNLNAKGGNGYIDLSWSVKGDISSVQIMRDTDANPQGRGRIATLSGASRSYRDTRVSKGVRYWYWVKYTDINGSNGNSNAGSAGPSASDSSPGTDTVKMIGFAAQSGNDGLSTTTGGGNARPITVTSCDALVSALSASGAVVVHIPANTTIDCRTNQRTQQACKIHCPSYSDDPNKLFYRIPVGNQTCTELGSKSNSDLVNRTRNETVIHVKSNKTLEGIGANTKLVGANLYLQDVKNIIIRNLSIENVNPGLIEAGDGISMNNTSHVWLDHLRFSLISDGHIDMYDSHNVTLSWNLFKGENTAVCGGKHHYTQLIFNSQVTLHHNEWRNISGRNPKIDGSESRVHLFNNFWKNVTYFSIGVGGGAQAKVEGNYFENAAKPHWDTGNGLIDADLTSNRYTGISAKDPDRDTGSRVFSDINLYRYTLESASNIPNIVDKGVGPK
jgi:pectate lyase